MKDEQGGAPVVEEIDGVRYPVEQTDNSVRPEDGDQSDAYAEVDLGEES